MVFMLFALLSNRNQPTESRHQCCRAGSLAFSFVPFVALSNGSEDKFPAVIGNCLIEVSLWLYQSYHVIEIDPRYTTRPSSFPGVCSAFLRFDVCVKVHDLSVESPKVALEARLEGVDTVSRTLVSGI